MSCEDRRSEWLLLPIQESAKFREGLLQQLEANPITASEKAKIADVCTKVMNALSSSHFSEMRVHFSSTRWMEELPEVTSI